MKVYADGKEVRRVTDSTRLTVLRSVPMLVAFLIGFVAIGFLAATDGGEGGKLLAPTDGEEVFNWRAVGFSVLALIVVVPVGGLGLVRLMKWWWGWIQRSEVLVETE